MASSSTQPRPIATAPAATNGNPSPQQEASPMPTMAFACVTCARRKLKCDKTGPPCSTCRKSRLECHYEAPVPRKRKRKQVDDVHERLEHYERLLKEHGILDQSTKESPPERSPPDVAEAKLSFPNGSAQPQDRTGKLYSGRGKTWYIDSTLWKNLGQDDFNPSSDEEDNADEQEGAVWKPVLSGDPVSTYLLGGGTSAGRSLLDYHPTYDIAIKLWDTYVSHVEPIAKLVHVPTGLAMVQRAAANPSTASKAMECLLFAIYHLAVVAMSDNECQELLGQTRSVLQSLYYEAVRQAMVNASFLRTSELMVLQAYIMFLLSVRSSYDPHTFWILTGIAVRIAQRMGLHRDGDALGLKPFDVEIRRRVFWQLLPLDGMSAQISGTGIAVPYYSWDTKQALNVDDKDIWPDMTEKPVERTGATDMIFCRCRAEVGRFHQKTKPFTGPWARLFEAGDSQAREAIDHNLNELENTLESKFFRYCDFVKPLHCLTLAMGRGAMAIGRLRLRLPRVRGEVNASIEERIELFNLAVRALDYCLSVLSNPVLSRYSWHLQSFVQLDPLIWLLSELRRNSPVITEPNMLWAKIEQLFTSIPQIMTRNRVLNVAICKLTLRTWESQPANTELPFITRLRAIVANREGSTTDNALNTGASTNPWSPQDASADLPTYDFTKMGGANDAFPGTMMMEDFGVENFDWTFWDQLVHNPEAFPNV